MGASAIVIAIAVETERTRTRWGFGESPFRRLCSDQLREFVLFFRVQLLEYLRRMAVCLPFIPLLNFLSCYSWRCVLYSQVYAMCLQLFATRTSFSGRSRGRSAIGASSRRRGTVGATRRHSCFAGSHSQRCVEPEVA